MEELLRGFFTPHCYQEFAIHHNFFDAICLKLMVSKILGLLIIAGSLIIKVPQILKIQNAKSAQGINLASNMLELVGYLLTLSLCFRSNFPFSTYGETFFVSFQNLVIIYQIFFFGGGLTPQYFTIMAMYGSLVYLLLANPGNLVSLQVLQGLQMLNLPILFSARIPQIWTCYKMKSAGQLAFFTWLLNFAGTLARVFTTFQETDDQVLLLSYSLASMFNGIIFGQILLYGNAPIESATKKKKS